MISGVFQHCSNWCEKMRVMINVAFIMADMGLILKCQILFIDFLSRHTIYFVVLAIINGSVVEIFCSQLKCSVAIKLTSINYSIARATVILKFNYLLNNYLCNKHRHSKKLQI